MAKTFQTARIFLPPMAGHILGNRMALLPSPPTHAHMSDIQDEDEMVTIALDGRDIEELEWSRLRAHAIDV